MKLFVNPAHGNEPFILGALIANKLRSLLDVPVEIIIPHLYSQQQKILDENGVHDVILDSDLGNFYRRMLFTNGDFSAYLKVVLTQRDTVESDVRIHITERYGSVDIEINTGSRIRIAHEIYYAFPAAVSQLLRYVLNENGNLGFNGSDLERSLIVAEQVEQDYAAVFIPALHTFSYDPQRGSVIREVPTPPMKPLPLPCTLAIPSRSIYCMPSGTGSEVQTILDRAAQLTQEGYTVFVPSWIQDVPYKKETPLVIAHPHVVRVVGRAGWGTLWTCQQAEKAFEHVSYRAGDDPEIYFNIKTLEAKPLLETTALQRSAFSTPDGIEHIAKHIVASRT